MVAKVGSVNEVSGQNALDAGGLERPTAKRQPSYVFSDLLIPMSNALDLAEGREPGHAQRVTFISMAIANAREMDNADRLACVYGALVHDIGVICAGAGLSEYARGDERLVFAPMPLLTPEEAATGTDSPEDVAQRIVDHVLHGSRVTQELALPAATVQGVTTHHERWDGTGYPHGLRGDAIPLVGRIIGLADQIEALASGATPLFARRNFATWLSRFSGRDADPELVDVLRDLGRSDDFWLGLYNEELAADVSRQCARFREPRTVKLDTFIEAFADLMDSRLPYTDGVSRNVARLVERLGRAIDLDDQHVRLLRAAAYLHDVGQLAVAERIMAKPGILSVEELEVLRLHPIHSHDVVAGISGLEEVAEWVAAHHERVDGRGYPDGKAGDEIPMEARILAIVDSWVAITSDRPHRARVSPEEARRMLRSAAGTQLDARLVEVFLREVVGSEPVAKSA
jgi:HD-GYP domain-containing protein (c-di-GMP phosphodiesterase class II)